MASHTDAPQPVMRSWYSQDKFFGLVSISRDGSRLVYGDTGAESPMHLVLPMAGDQLNPQAVPGGENAVFPFFSPDGEWIGYFALNDRKLRKIRISGGSPMTLPMWWNPRAASGPR